VGEPSDAELSPSIKHEGLGAVVVVGVGVVAGVRNAAGVEVGGVCLR